MNYRFTLLLVFLTMTAISCGGGSTSQSQLIVSEPEEIRIEHLSAGTATVDINTANAFSLPSKTMQDGERILRFNLGNDFFENPWIAGSASTSMRDGVGGLLNNNACQDCHIRDGRGHAPAVEVSTNDVTNDFSSILFKVVKTDISEQQRQSMLQSQMANIGDTHVGSQLQHDAIPGVPKEVTLDVRYHYENSIFSDGHVVELRRPQWLLHSNAAVQGYDFNSDTVFSARIAPPMIGLGLLELIDEKDILQQADPYDSNNDGISGKANYVWSMEKQAVTLGRFGWKASQPSLLEQTAGAFINDMGLTSRLHLEENCMPQQTECINTENGNGDSVNSYNYEVSDRVLDVVSFYTSHLGVPQRRNAYSEKVQRGKTLFNDIGCSSCHIAVAYTTKASILQPELSEQKIFPYTDLLVHDMGEALADVDIQNNAIGVDVPVAFLATAREWRTPPLWGLGLAKTVDPEATFLHDGRARSIMEAVLWHGGEAKNSRDRVLEFNAEERDALLSFLNDL